MLELELARGGGHPSGLGRGRRRGRHARPRRASLHALRRRSKRPRALRPGEEPRARHRAVQPGPRARPVATRSPTAASPRPTGGATGTRRPGEPAPRRAARRARSRPRRPARPRLGRPRHDPRRQRCARRRRSPTSRRRSTATHAAPTSTTSAASPSSGSRGGTRRRRPTVGRWSCRPRPVKSRLQLPRRVPDRPQPAGRRRRRPLPQGTRPGRRTTRGCGATSVVLSSTRIARETRKRPGSAPSICSRAASRPRTSPPCSSRRAATPSARARSRPSPRGAAGLPGLPEPRRGPLLGSWTAPARGGSVPARDRAWRAGAEGRPEETPVPLAPPRRLPARCSARLRRLGSLARAAVALEPRTGRVAATVAGVYEQLGDRRSAIHWLDVALGAGYPPEMVDTDPSFEALRKDSRWASRPAQAGVGRRPTLIRRSHGKQGRLPRDRQEPLLPPQIVPAFVQIDLSGWAGGAGPVPPT